MEGEETKAENKLRREHEVFLNFHAEIYRKTVQEEQELLTDARYSHAYWGAVGCYLQKNGLLRSDRAQPLWECTTSGWSSVLLASMGYYREAIGLLRQEMDLVLWEWSLRRGTSDPMKHKALFFQEGGGAGVRWKQDIKPLFDLPEVEEYRAFVVEACGNDDHLRRELLQPVNESDVSYQRKLQHEAVHSHPKSWNIVSYPTFDPFPEFAANAFEQWAKAFRESQGMIAVWCLLMFPDLMRWSQMTSLEHCQGDPTMNHDMWFRPVLHPIQTGFFENWRPVGFPAE